VEIKQYQHGEGDFWQRMGEQFASPVVRRELGRAMTSVPEYVWWVALEDDQVVGFAALAPQHDDSAELRHAYVMPEHRGQGLYCKLLEARIEYGREHFARLYTVATDASKPGLEAHGFVEIGKRGRYTRMELVFGG